MKLTNFPDSSEKKFEESFQKQILEKTGLFLFLKNFLFINT